MQMPKQDLVLVRHHLFARVGAGVAKETGECVAEQELILADTKFVIPKKFMNISPQTINNKSKGQKNERRKQKRS